MDIYIRKSAPGDIDFFRKAFYEFKPTFHSFSDKHAWDTFAELLLSGSEGMAEVLTAENDGELAALYIVVTSLNRFWQRYLQKLGFVYVIKFAITSMFQKKTGNDSESTEEPVDPEFAELFSKWLKEIPGRAKAIFLYVRPESRGSGTVQAIIEKMENVIGDQGFTFLDGLIQHSNRRSRHLNEKLGYDIRNAGPCLYKTKKLR